MCIRADHATEAELLTALEAGASYASTGVTLGELDVRGGELVLGIEPQWELHYRTTFIGAHGRILDVQDGLAPVHRLRDGDGYVRARVEDSDGLVAWTQPVFPD